MCDRFYGANWVHLFALGCQRQLIWFALSILPALAMRVITCAHCNAHGDHDASQTTPPRARFARPGKKATNLSLSTDVLEAAKDIEINISQVCDNYLRELVRRKQEQKWREDHADFIAAYNATVEAEGLPLDEWRSF
jgi:antitoxin CcdA